MKNQNPSQRIGRKCRLISAHTEQNNNHTQIDSQQKTTKDSSAVFIIDKLTELLVKGVKNQKRKGRKN